MPLNKMSAVVPRPDRFGDDPPELTTIDELIQARIDGRFADQPLVEAELRETMSKTYNSLGESSAEAAQLMVAAQEGIDEKYRLYHELGA